VSALCDEVLPGNIRRLRDRYANCYRTDLRGAYREGFDGAYQGMEPTADYRGDLGIAYVCGGLDGCRAAGTRIDVEVPFGRGFLRCVV